MNNGTMSRLPNKRQTLDEAYAPPANFLEIEVVNPITHGVGKNRYTDYEVRLRVRNHLSFSHHSTFPTRAGTFGLRKATKSSPV